MQGDVNIYCKGLSISFHCSPEVGLRVIQSLAAFNDMENRIQKSEDAVRLRESSMLGRVFTGVFGLKYTPLLSI